MNVNCMSFLRRRNVVGALAGVALSALAPFAQAFEGPELYPGEKALYAEAAKEGLATSCVDSAHGQRLRCSCCLRGSQWGRW